MKSEFVKCFICNGDVTKDVVALNKKMIGRKIEKFFCLNCMADHFEVSTEELLNKIQEFKEQGCRLF